MRFLTLTAALVLFAFALGAAVASQETYRRAIGNDSLWGQGRWGVIVDPNDNRKVIEYIVDDRAKGRAFMIRTLVAGATALAGLFLLVTWVNKKSQTTPADKADVPSSTNTRENQGQP